MSQDTQISITEFVDPNDPVQVTLGEGGILDKPIRFESYIRQVFETRLLIAMPPEPAELEALVRPGSPLSLVFLKNQKDIPPFSTEVVSYMKEGPNAGCWIRVPDDFKDTFLRRRRHARIPVKFPIKVEFRVDNVVRTLVCESINLSGGGMRFASQQPFGLKQVIILEFQPEANQLPFRLVSEVVMCKPSPFRSTRNPDELMVAVRFVNVSQAIEDRLVGVCFRQELQQLKHLKQD